MAQQAPYYSRWIFWKENFHDNKRSTDSNLINKNFSWTASEIFQDYSTWPFCKINSD